ncbi:hypothetical protein M9Y10_007945 [Tritrichomonas musculus]|uniref:UBC core domain-containing protein n=1 Tax=Tritrichomonas musculus TaxID=1915356 RepID=A0ABR2J336_9EUKA
MARAAKELKKLQDNPEEGITISIQDDNFLKWIVKMEGPSGSPYEGGILTFKVDFPVEYPHEQPVISFYPIVFHPNVNQDDGIICLDMLREWSPSFQIRKLFEEIKSVLVIPAVGHFDDGQICNLYENDREEYIRQAKDWTAKYAH